MFLHNTSIIVAMSALCRTLAIVSDSVHALLMIEHWQHNEVLIHELPVAVHCSAHIIV
jgi:hypothetical protein